MIDGLFDLKRALETSRRISLAAFPGHFGVGRTQSVDDATKREYVCVVIHIASCDQLRRSIDLRPGGTFQHGMRIRIRQTEVYQLDVVPVVGQHDVGRLQIPVDNLLGVHVSQSVTDLADDLGGQCLADLATGQQGLQRSSVHPLHLNAVAKRRNVHKTIVLADVRMAQ